MNKRGQLLAYMAMVQASRKRRDQSDYIVWGVVSDCLEYWFYQLGMQGEWSLVIFRSTREDWQSKGYVAPYFTSQCPGDMLIIYSSFVWPLNTPSLFVYKQFRSNICQFQKKITASQSKP